MKLNIMTSTGIESKEVLFRLDYKDLEFFTFYQDSGISITETSSGQRFLFILEHSVEVAHRRLKYKMETLGYDKVVSTIKRAIEENGRAN